MLCTPTICNVAVTKTLIDGVLASSCSPWKPSAFSTCHTSCSASIKPFSGVGGGAAHSLGQIRLPVTFGTRDNYRTELVDFDIAHISLPYNSILGFPALAQFMEITHPAYNLMKMPGSKSVLTIKGDIKEASMTLKLALKTAATAQPSDVDTFETKGATPTKKKQFFTQDKAETK